MTISISRKIVLVIISAGLLAVPFLDPRFFPLAWFAFVPLLLVIERAGSIRRATVYGWVMGTTAHLIGFHWLVYTISVFGGFNYPISSVVFLLYALLQGLEIAIFAWLVRRIGFGPLQVFPALFWITLEFWFPLLFPWYLANSQISFSWFVQSADIVGPYGVGFIIMWWSAAVYKALFGPNYQRRKCLTSLACAALLAIASLVYGWYRLGTVQREIAAARKISVSAVQGNIDIDLKWNPSQVKTNLEQHKRLTEQVRATPLIIWPESAVEVWLPDDLAMLPKELMPQISPQSYFIFGTKSFLGKPGTRDFKAFNSAFFSDGSGRILGRYRKQVLLAFGEYLPFAKILLLLPAMPLADGFTPGNGPLAFHLPGEVRIGPLICYEDLMPDLARKFISESNANLLVNLTNDAWYGRSVGPWEHARLAQSRAIETRRSLLRVTNTGVTSLINAKGEMVESLPTFTSSVLNSQVDILNGETYYVRFGDWFAWTITVISAGLLLRSLTPTQNRTLAGHLYDRG